MLGGNSSFDGSLNTMGGVVNYGVRACDCPEEVWDFPVLDIFN